MTGHVFSPKQIGVCTGINQDKDEFIIMLLPHQ